MNTFDETDEMNQINSELAMLDAEIFYCHVESADKENPVADVESDNGNEVNKGKTDWTNKNNLTKFDLSCLHFSFKKHINFCCWGRRDNPSTNKTTQLKSGEIKLDKVPCTPIVDFKGNITGFIAARANDPTTWTTFDAAYKAHQLGLVNGVGFQFGSVYGHDAFFGIDIDSYKGCPQDAINEILSRFKGCYVEKTPNGGYHIIGKGRLLKTGKAIRTKIDDSKNFWLEGYGGDSNRYFTMTGYVLAGHEDGSPEFNPAEALTWIHETYFKEEEKPATVKPVIRQTLERHGYSPSPSSSFDKSYQPLVDEYNRCVGIDAVLTRNGYIEVKKGNQTRYLGPTSTSGMPGVVLLGDDRVFSHSVSDPLGDGHSHDAFDCFKILECGGDFAVAIAEVKRLFPTEATTTTPIVDNDGKVVSDNSNVVSMNAWRVQAFGKMLFAYEHGASKEVAVHPALEHLRLLFKGNLRVFNNEVLFPLFNGEYDNGNKPCGFISINADFERKYRYLPRTETKTWRAGSYVKVRDTSNTDTIIVCTSIDSGFSIAQESEHSVVACVEATNIPFVISTLESTGKKVFFAADNNGSEIAHALAYGWDFALPQFAMKSMSELRGVGSGLIADSLTKVISPSSNEFSLRFIPAKPAEFAEYVDEKIAEGIDETALIALMKNNGKADEFNMAGWELLVKRRFAIKNAYVDSNYIVDNNRYITLPEGNSIALIAPMGTGKTTAIKGALVAGQIKTVVSHRIVLAKAIAESYGVPFYQERMSSYTGVSVVINSLANSNMNKMNGILVIDEINQVLDQMASGFIVRDEPVFNALCERIKKSEKVYCADAYMNEHTIEFVRKLRPDLKVLRSTYKTMEGVTAKVYSDSKLWTRRLKKSIRNGMKIAVTSNSKEEAKTLFNLVRRNFPDKKVAVFTADSESEDVLAFSQNPNGYIQGLDVLIYSPVISAGVSIDVEYFDAIFSYASGCVTVSSEVMQQLGRIRPKTPVYAFVSNKRHRKLQSFDEIVNNVLRQSKKITSFEKRALRAKRVATKDGVLIRAEFELTDFEQFCAERIHAREEDLRNLSANVQSHLANMGYKVVVVENEEMDDADEIKDGIADDKRELHQELVEIKEDLHLREDLEIVNARVLSNDEADILSAEQQKNHADVCAIKRYVISKFYGKEVTMELMQHHRDNYRKASKLKLIMFPQKNIEKDFFEHNVSTKRSNRIFHKQRTLEGNFLRKALAVTGVECVGDEKNGLEFKIMPNPFFYRGHKNLNKFTRWINKRGNEAYKSFMPQIASKMDDNPERAVLQVLKSIGLEFETARAKVGKKSASVYTLKPESVKKLNSWANDFRQAHRRNSKEFVVMDDITQAA